MCMSNSLLYLGPSFFLIWRHFRTCSGRRDAVFALHLQPKWVDLYSGVVFIATLDMNNTVSWMQSLWAVCKIHPLTHAVKIHVLQLMHYTGKWWLVGVKVPVWRSIGCPWSPQMHCYSLEPGAGPEGGGVHLSYVQYLLVYATVPSYCRIGGSCFLF